MLSQDKQPKYKEILGLLKNHTISATWIKYQLVINVMRLMAERCVRHHVTAVTNDITANATEKLGSFFFMSEFRKLVTFTNAF